MTDPITSDNIHLSKVIQNAAVADDSIPLSLCTDPKVLEFIRAATSANTIRAYQSDVAHFLAWGGSIPADPALVARYLASHADSLSVATLARRVVAIRGAHILRGRPDPTKTELIRLTIRGIRRRYGRPQRRVAPLKLEQLAAIISGLGGTARDSRDRALLLIGFAGAFRRSELIAVNCDCIKPTTSGFEIMLPRSKTDQEGMGRYVVIPRLGGPVCPAEALDCWLQVPSIAVGPLFRQVNKAGKILGGRLSAAAVANIVKGHVRKIDLDPARYSGHSLRAGFVTSAATAGLPTWKIKQQTGHVSEGVVDRYIREVNSIDDVAAFWRLPTDPSHPFSADQGKRPLTKRT
jgi:integrase